MNVVITGANRGVGLALTEAWRAKGAHVIAGCRTPASATALAATGAEIHAFDQASEASIAAFAAAIGDRQVDVLVNCAGIDATALGAPDGERTVLQLSADDFRGVMEVNVVGPMLLTRALVPNLKLGPGKIINITSQIGSMELGMVMGRDVSYAASKSALNMVSLKFAWALKGDGIPVVMVHPGWVRTDMGGPSATVDPVDSAAGIIAVTEAATIESTGTFVRWDGSTHPW